MKEVAKFVCLLYTWHLIVTMMWSNLKSITQSWSMDSSTWIGLSKLGTLAWIFTLIFVHEVFTITAFLYLAFYISYVLLYFVKNTVMADKAFDRKINVMDVMLTVPILFGTYWLIPYIAIVYVPSYFYFIFSSFFSMFRSYQEFPLCLFIYSPLFLLLLNLTLV